MRLLLCHHIRDGSVNHYVGSKPVDVAEFRERFRDLRRQERLTPALPESTGFGYRIVWEVV